MPHTYKWEEASINEKIELWSSLKEKIKITELYSEQLIPFEKAEYPEAAIYDDFDAFNRDAEIMRSFHEANPTKKLELVNCFSDARFRTFARRIIYDNHYEILGEEDRSKFSNALLHRLNEDSEVPWITTSKALEEADKLLKERPERQPQLETIKAFLVSYKQG